MKNKFNIGDKAIILYFYYKTNPIKYFSFIENDKDIKLANKTINIEKEQVESINEYISQYDIDSFIDYLSGTYNFNFMHDDNIVEIVAINNNKITAKYTKNNTIYYNVDTSIIDIYNVEQFDKLVKNKVVNEAIKRIKTYNVSLEIEKLLNDISNINCTDSNYKKVDKNNSVDPILKGISKIGWASSSLFC
jgi:hypothetical protein